MHDVLNLLFYITQSTCTRVAPTTTVVWTFPREFNHDLRKRPLNFPIVQSDGDILSTGFLFPDDSSLCQVDKNWPAQERTISLKSGAKLYSAAMPQLYYLKLQNVTFLLERKMMPVYIHLQTQINLSYTYVWLCIHVSTYVLVCSSNKHSSFLYFSPQYKKWWNSLKNISIMKEFAWHSFDQ